MPFSIVYRSLPMRAPADVILDIIRAADKRNLATGVSGMLYYNPVQYFQVLQGPQPAVLDIFPRSRMTIVTWFSTFMSFMHASVFQQGACRWVT